MFSARLVIGETVVTTLRLSESIELCSREFVWVQAAVIIIPVRVMMKPTVVNMVATLLENNKDNPQISFYPTGVIGFLSL